MKGFNYFSDIEDCRLMIEFLLDKDNKNIVVYYHEIGPVTTLRYKGYHFYLKYNKDSFARVSCTNNDSKAIEVLGELGNTMTEIIGNPIAYYDMLTNDVGFYDINPTLEWCLDKEMVDQYINAIINNQLFDDGSKCLNVKLCNKTNNNCEKYMQLSLVK